MPKLTFVLSKPGYSLCPKGQQFLQLNKNVNKPKSSREAVLTGLWSRIKKHGHVTVGVCLFVSLFDYWVATAALHRSKVGQLQLSGRNYRPRGNPDPPAEQTHT